MGSNPDKPSNDDPGGSDPRGDDQTEKKTRFVPRPELAQPSREAPEETEAPAGTVIGRTRLMGNHGQMTQAGGGVKSSTPTMGMGSAKTELIRGEGMGSEPVAGWMVVVKGPGRGGFRPVFVGMNSVGRDTSQRVSLDFGDESISREEHAFVTYDEETRCFFLQHGGKSNLVRLGNDPVLTPTEIKPNDLIRIGKTTLLFVPCCGPDFSWTDEVQNA